MAENGVLIAETTSVECTPPTSCLQQQHSQQPAAAAAAPLLLNNQAEKKWKTFADALRHSQTGKRFTCFVLFLQASVSPSLSLCLFILSLFSSCSSSFSLALSIVSLICFMFLCSILFFPYSQQQTSPIASFSLIFPYCLCPLLALSVLSTLASLFVLFVQRNRAFLSAPLFTATRVYALSFFLSSLEEQSTDFQKKIFLRMIWKTNFFVEFLKFSHFSFSLLFSLSEIFSLLQRF